MYTQALSCDPFIHPSTMLAQPMNFRLDTAPEGMLQTSFDSCCVQSAVFLKCHYSLLCLCLFCKPDAQQQHPCLTHTGPCTSSSTACLRAIQTMLLLHCNKLGTKGKIGKESKKKGCYLGLGLQADSFSVDHFCPESRKSVILTLDELCSAQNHSAGSFWHCLLALSVGTVCFDAGFAQSCRGKIDRWTDSDDCGAGRDTQPAFPSLCRT